MLPRAARLKRNRDFRAVLQRSRSWATPNLVLHVRPRPPRETLPPTPRLGFVISKKVARRAHDRNRLKRRLREICRTQVLPGLRAASFDAVFVARAPAASADFARLSADVAQLGRQAGWL